MKTKPTCLFLLIILLLTAACTSAQPLSAATPVATTAATPVPPTAAAPVAIDAPVQPTDLAPAENWDDRSIFSAGLSQAHQNTLQQLAGASVYHLDVKISATLDHLEGQEIVRYTNQENTPLDAVYFQLFPNMTGGKSSISSVKVDGQAVQPVVESGNTTARVPLSAALQPGEQVVIQMDFKLEVPTQLGGNYGLFAYLENILALDGFYPAIPVYDERGWHAGPLPPNADTTFQDTSFYVVRVTAPASLVLVASGSQVDAVKQGDQQVVTFAAGPARDFYLAASPDFAVTSQTVGETKINSYALKGMTDGARAALEIAIKALESFNARFGSYPYSEYDIVSTPMQGATGVEYPGVAAINYLAYDLSSTISGTPAAVILESTLAHEVGHQWFYNVVGNDQANEPWLDEALTQYVTGLYFLDRYGQPGMDGYAGSWQGRWSRVDQQPIPIGLPAGSYQVKEYGAIVYGRGPLFVQALAEKMGQSTFDQFLKDYYLANQWGISSGAAFKRLAEKSCQCDLTPIFDEWVYEK